ncbi:hypothetical protein Tco_0447938 [Tanacetum coccineum]
MAQQPMRSKEELCPTNVRLPPNKSNVRIDLEEKQDEPLFDISLEILKNNIIYNALTHTTEVSLIYMQQFGDTVVVNKLHQPWRTILSILNKSLTGKASRIDRAKEPITYILWGVVNFVNVYFDEKLKYVTKAETRSKPTFGMLIPKAMMSEEIKESQAYMNYLKKYQNAPSGSSTLRHGMGKGLMRRGDIPTPKKNKYVVQKHSKTITAEDNVLSDHDEAMEYAKQVKLKAKEKLSPDAQLLLNLRRQGKESKKQNSPPKDLPTPSPSVTTTSAEDYTRYLNDPKDVQMFELLNEPLNTKATTMTVASVLNIIHETEEQVT